MANALGHQRNDTIDCFRAVAILSVMIYHFGGDVAPAGTNAAIRSILEIGRFGVHLFFIISGLVIAITLRRSASLLDFATKRLARIYPAYLAAMLITVFVAKSYVISKFWVSKWDILIDLQPYDFGQKLADPSYWSLTYEIQFYAIAGLLYAWLGRGMLVGLAMITISCAMLVAFYPQLANEHLLMVYLPLFLAGVATAAVAFDHERQGWVALAIAVGCYAITSALFETRAHQYPVWMMHVFVLGLGAVMIWLVVAGIKLKLPALAAIGRFSYSLYLVHQVIGLTIIASLRAHGVNPFVAAAFAVTIVMPLGFGMHRIVEERGRLLVLAGYARLRPSVSRQVSPG